MTFEEEQRQLRERAQRLVEMRVLVSLSMFAYQVNETVRGGCPHGRDIVLWREVSKPIYENLADRLKPGDRIPFGTKPEEWTRVASVWMDIVDVHSLMRRPMSDFQFAIHEGLCLVCARAEGRRPDIFDVTGRSKRVSR